MLLSWRIGKLSILLLSFFFFPYLFFLKKEDRENRGKERERGLPSCRGYTPPDVIGHLYLTGASLSLSCLISVLDCCASLLALSFLNLLSNGIDGLVFRLVCSQKEKKKRKESLENVTI